MALHAVDKNSLDRSSPTPNSHDKVQNTGGVMAKGTTSVNYIQQGNPNFGGPAGDLFKNQSNIGQFVQSATVECNWVTNAAEHIFAIEHNLGYAPLVMGVLNSSTVTAFPASLNNAVSVMLPTFLSFSISGGSVAWTQYIQLMSDIANVDIYLINANAASSGSFVVTYYLYKQAVLTA